MASSNSVRAPVTSPGNQGFNHPFVEQQSDWGQQYTSKELTFPDYRSLSKQYTYSPQSFLQEPAVQNKSLMSSTPFQLIHNQLPASAQPFQPSQAASVGYQGAAQPDPRPPPPLPYHCKYGGQTLPGTRRVAKPLSMDIPHNPESHPSETKIDLCTGFQQQGQNTSESVRTIGKFCDLKVNVSIMNPFSGPVPPFGGNQTSQSNQEKKVDSYDPVSHQGQDPTVTKEKLVRDIKSLMEVKKKFLELARKIKINKDLLVAAGCKPTNSSSSGPPQHSELPLKGIPAKSDNPCSVELLTTCLNLWKKQPSQTIEENTSKPSEVKQHNEAPTPMTSVALSQPLEAPFLVPCSVERNSQNRVANPSQETTLSLVMQNCEPSGANGTKGTELQIAVVSPLILSNVKPLSVTEVAPEVLPEAACPVTKEDGICSFQNQLTESTAVSAALEVDVTRPVVRTCTSTTASLLTPGEKQNEPNQSNSENLPATGEEKVPLSCHQPNSPKSQDGALRAEGMLQIENICSLVEGDVAYNSQIAQIFSSCLLGDVEPQKLSPACPQEADCSQQKEQVEPITESKDSELHKDKCSQCTDLPYKITVLQMVESLEPQGVSSLESSETKRGVLGGSSVAETPKKGSTAEGVCCPLAAAQQETAQENTPCSSGLAQNPAGSESHGDDTSVMFLHDQLSELVREFPYGIEQVTREQESSVGQKPKEQFSKDQAKGKPSHDCKEPMGQIKITILNSEEMKELFPEQDDEACDADPQGPCDDDRSVGPPKEKLVTQVGGQGETQATPAKETPGCAAGLDKDRIHCCALGWLSVVYEGVPRCHCASEGPLALEAREKRPHSPLRPSRGGQGVSDTGIAVIKVDPASDNPETLTSAAKKSHLETAAHSSKGPAKPEKSSSRESTHHFPGQVSSRKGSKVKTDSSKPRGPSSVNKGQGAVGQFASKYEKLNPSQSNKRKLKFHEVRFQSRSKTPRPDQGSQGLQDKGLPRTSNPLQANMGLFPDKGLCKRSSSAAQVRPPGKEELLLKDSSSQKTHLEKRKSEQVKAPGVEAKKRRCDKQEQSESARGPHKLCALSKPTGSASVRENSVLSAASSGLKDTRGRAVFKGNSILNAKSWNLKDPKERVAVKENSMLNAKSSSLRDTKDRAVVKEKPILNANSLGVKDPKERVAVKENSVLNVNSSSLKDTRERAVVKENQTLSAKLSDWKDTGERADGQEKGGPGAKSSGVKDGPTKVRRVITPQEYFQRQRQKEMENQTAKKTCLENAPGESPSARPDKLCAPAAGCGKPNDKHGSRVHATKEASKASTSQSRDLRIHPPEEPKVCSSPGTFTRGGVDGKPPRKALVGSARLDQTSATRSHEEPSPLPPQAKEQKSYLNRVTFKCTEQESICLSTFDSSQWKVSKDRDKSQEIKPRMFSPRRDSAEKRGMLEFKLCPDPDVLLKNSNCEKGVDVKLRPQKQTATQDGNSRLCQRSYSADGLEAPQKAVKDSKGVFQTYKQMYLQKRSCSLGSSPVK
ncbi:retroelement silencing factor 1 [Ctenodactylus gundi]